MTFSLVRCDARGHPMEPIPIVAEEITATYCANADLYRRVGYLAPWVSYLAVDSGRAVGGGAFVGPPQNNRVEIAYFTLSELQGLGYATKTAAALLAVARDTVPGIGIVAFTLPAENASTRILTRLGLKRFGDAYDTDAREVWEWRS